MADINAAAAAAITAVTEGSEAEPLLRQVTEEVETIRDEMNKQQPDTSRLSAAAGAIGRVCLEQLDVDPPDDMKDASVSAAS